MLRKKGCAVASTYERTKEARPAAVSSRCATIKLRKGAKKMEGTVSYYVTL